MKPFVFEATARSYSAVVAALKEKSGNSDPPGCCVVAKLRQPTMLLTPPVLRVAAGVAVEVGRELRSANARTPFLPTSVRKGVGLGAGDGKPATLTSSNPPSS
jgi:hypothetical protein